MNQDALQAALRAAVRGPVRFDRGTRAMYAADASNYRHVPIGVVAPVDAADAEAAVAVCRAHDVPVLPRGAGTSIAGNAVNAAVLLDFTRHMNAVLEIDPAARTARVQPGVVLDALRAAAASHGLTFGPDPSTHDRCTLGGMIGNNSCGAHSVAWGKTVDNVRALDVLTYRGERVTVGAGTPGAGAIPERLRALRDELAADIRAGVPKLTRRVSGYNLDALLPENGFDLAKALVGTEGSCVTVLAATVDLVPSPAARALAVLGFPDVYVAAEAAPAVRELGPLAIEGMDYRLIDARRAAARPGDSAIDALPDGRAWLYVETGGADAVEAEAAAKAVTRLGPSSAVFTSPSEQRALWRIREDGSGLVTRRPDGGEAWPGWEDAAVPPSRLASYLRAFDALLAEHRLGGAYYGHFGDGCLHVRIDFDLHTPAGIRGFRRFVTEAADLVVAHGGSLSGEHGDGQARGELLSRMYPPRLIDGFRAFKAAWDPDGRMNPGCVVDPAPLDADLRVFVAPSTLRTREQLGFVDDHGSFPLATRRCVGVARCVTDSGGVMCPSYRATGEERHSTRGRARLLFEMAAGQVLRDGWRSPEVGEALDLCLSCKGCKRDCPVGVDMAAYKTEYLAQRYHRRPRPASHYSMGALPRWLRLASRAPRLVNGLASRPWVAGLVKRLGGIAPERDIPQLAERPFTRSFTGSPGGGGDRVVLWPDTFTNHFDPQVAHAAVEVLERLGYRVEVPDRPVCCGLTWYSTGQLGAARRSLRRSVETLQPWLRDGVPIVGLEPSCTAMLRAEADQLLPGTGLPAAVHTFAEVLAGRLDRLPELGSAPRALVQTHCHQHADLGFADDSAVLAALGVRAEVLDSGCCGLAGNFGFERGHYDVSMACAERVLLPRVRAADPEVAVLADGFSCRTQLRQAGQREPLHLAQLAARAVRRSGVREPGPRS